MKQDLFHMTLLFWIIMDPLGNVPIFVSLLKHHDTKKQMKIIVRELCIALGFMVAFLFFGNFFFTKLHISMPSLQMTGGIILFILALRMIFSHHNEKKVRLPQDPLIVPLAVPAVAGPGILATIILYGSALGSNRLLVLLAVVVAWLFLFPFLLFAPYFKKLFGDNGIIALEQLFGFLLVLISTQMALTGLFAAFK